MTENKTKPKKQKPFYSAIRKMPAKVLSKA
jgi:hypothetical protein